VIWSKSAVSRRRFWGSARSRCRGRARRGRRPGRFRRRSPLPSPHRSAVRSRETASRVSRVRAAFSRPSHRHCDPIVPMLLQSPRTKKEQEAATDRSRLACQYNQHEDAFGMAQGQVPYLPLSGVLESAAATHAWRASVWISAAGHNEPSRCRTRTTALEAKPGRPAACRRVPAFGATCSFRCVPAIVSFLSPQPAFSRAAGTTLQCSLLAEHLVSPFRQCHQIGRRYKPSVFALKIGVANRTGP
jgi:hypothetical protein